MPRKNTRRIYEQKLWDLNAQKRKLKEERDFENVDCV